MIDKKIHYVWLGESNLPEFAHLCILGWKEKMPDYDIIQWDSSNIDVESIINESEFIKECYRRKLWAFVSDYIRLNILYRHGGIYLDTDVSVTKKFDDLLSNEFFVGFEDERYINGAIIGTTKKHPLILDMINFYKYEILDSELYTLPQIMTHVIKPKELLFNNVNLYPKEYFYPYHFEEVFDNDCITDRTYSIHWWGKSWWGKPGQEYLLSKHLKGIRKYWTYCFYYIRFRVSNLLKTIGVK